MVFGFKPYQSNGGNKHSSNYGSQRSDVISISNGERYPVTIQEFKRDADKLHPTQKPVALFEYLIKTYTNPGETVLDNCAGSGTTGIAAINTGRNYILIEQDPGYIQIINERLYQPVMVSQMHYSGSAA